MKGASTDTTHLMRASAAAERLRSVSSPEDGFAAVTEILSQLLGSEEFALFTINTAKKRLVLVASQGIDAANFRERSLDTGLIGRVARRGAAFIARRGSAITQRAPDEASLTACIPLMVEGAVTGVLAIFRLLPHKRKMVAGDMELLDLLSAHGAIAFGRSATSPKNVLIEPLADVAIEAQPPGPGQLRQVVVYPGEVFVSDASVELSTILGSCVAVCIWDTRFRFGGMSHFLLPETLPSQFDTLRFGDAAIPALLTGLERLGSERRNLRAKIFGGANVNGGATSPIGATLGLRNATLARTLLANAGIQIMAEDLGGTVGRKIRFRTDDGTALVKRLGSG
jgi:chemotaxis protein CheD